MKNKKPVCLCNNINKPHLPEYHRIADKSQPAPTPWKIVNRTDIKDANGLSLVESEANASLIVTAVNAYEKDQETINTLKALVGQLAELVLDKSETDEDMFSKSDIELAKEGLETYEALTKHTHNYNSINGLAGTRFCVCGADIRDDKAEGK